VPTKAPPAASRTGKKPTQLLDSSKTYVITMETNCGTFAFTLDPKESPNASASFVSLTDAGYFNKTIFHRIVPGFVIQGGDPTATGTGGPGYTTVDKPPATAAYTLGVVAMAKTTAQPAGAAGSQFFVVTVANAGLPADYAIIGKVTSGLDVVQRIGKLGTPNSETGAPTEVVEIEKATVSTS
jgi:cyclophilin family peptidyl-prolyl cis-trans isomerase